MYEDYIVLHQTVLIELERQADRWFAKGYVPLGGLVFAAPYFMQAIARKGPTPAEPQAERPAG